MKKHLLKIGKTLTKAEQKHINGGGQGSGCETAMDCYDFTTEDDGSGCWQEWSCHQAVCVAEEYVCG